MTEIIRTERVEPPRRAQVLLFAFMGVIVLFSALLVVGFFQNFPQPTIALWFGFLFLNMAVLIDLYRRYYVPDEMVGKVRLPKVIPKREFK